MPEPRHWSSAIQERANLLRFDPIEVDIAEGPAE
jgi:hypothetical protein